MVELPKLFLVIFIARQHSHIAILSVHLSVCLSIMFRDVRNGFFKFGSVSVRF